MSLSSSLVKWVRNTEVKSRNRKYVQPLLCCITADQFSAAEHLEKRNIAPAPKAPGQTGQTGQPAYRGQNCLVTEPNNMPPPDFPNTIHPICFPLVGDFPPHLSPGSRTVKSRLFPFFKRRAAITLLTLFSFRRYQRDGSGRFFFWVPRSSAEWRTSQKCQRLPPFSAHCQMWATKGKKKENNPAAANRIPGRERETAILLPFQSLSVHAHIVTETLHPQTFIIFFVRKLYIPQALFSHFTIESCPRLRKKKKSSRLSLSLFENHRIIF